MKTMCGYFAVATLLALISPLVSNAEDTVTHLRTTNNDRNSKAKKAPKVKKDKVTKAPKVPKFNKGKGTKESDKEKRR